MHSAYHEILDFWFSTQSESRWYQSDDKFDKAIYKKFHELYTQAKAQRLHSWDTTPEGRLAYIIILDQFPRNMFRNTAQAFETDHLAVNMTYDGLQYGDDLWLKTHKPDAWRAFFYMPLMHSESLEDQQRCVELFATHGPEKNLHFARLHHDIIARFGRFPYRNVILNRTSTEHELHFLQQKSSGF